MSQYETIYFAGGCFWGTEHLFKQINGVSDTQVGYANGIVENPSYETVCTGKTHAAETVRVVFDPSVISLSSLIRIYLLSIDPTSVNRQGGDCGTQYRTGIYYTEEKQIPVIKSELEAEAKRHDLPLAIEVLPLRNFYPAEEYHQDYLDKNPSGYCHINPELFKLAGELSR